VTVLCKKFTRVCYPVLAGTVFCLLLLCSASLRAQDTSNEFWPEFNVFLKLNEKSRLFFLYSATKLDARQTYSDGSFGAHLDLYAVPLLGPAGIT